MAIQALYQKYLKRDATADELRSEEENVGKYGLGQLESNLTERAASTNHRPYDSQTSNAAELQANARADDRQGIRATQDGGGASAAPQSVAAQWNATPTQAAPAAAAPATDPRRDALYQQLLQRSQQSLAVDRNDPGIRQQADAFGANQERSRRNYISDIAEQAGPLANIRGEERMAAERAGINAGSFESELIGRELGARREEIAGALGQMGGMLSADQAAALQRELAQLDAALKQQGLNLQGQELALQGELGRGGLGLQKRGQDLSNDQFLRELSLREWDRGQHWDHQWASL